MMKPDINSHTTKFISSLKMENSEIQEKIIALGKKLVDNFKSGSEDATGHWMAHYIAEQIITIEANQGGNTLASKECFETILKLWHHQAYFPRGLRPFEQFDEIFHAIERINPDNSRPFFYTESELELTSLSEEAALWVNIARSLDQNIRSLIKFSFHQALDTTMNEETESWLAAISGITEPREAFIIQHYEPELNKDDDAQKKLDKKREILEERIEQLNELDSLCKMIKEDMQEQLKVTT